MGKIIKRFKKKKPESDEEYQMSERSELTEDLEIDFTLEVES